MKRVTTSVLVGGLIAAGVAVAAPSAADAAGARPAFKAPFNCGQQWRGSAWTYYDGKPHNPMKSVDWNWGSGEDDHGKMVRASAGGTVAFAGTGGGGYGKMIVINHGNGWKTRYAHLKDGSLQVKKGDTVSRGRFIARVGRSGGQSSSHLHYEQIRDGNVVDAVVQGVRFDPNDVHYITSTTRC